MFYGFLADVLGLIHFGYVSFVVLGQLLILVGICLRWRWIRDMRFRLVHLAMILIVALESLGEVMCPLTVWENKLRLLAGQTVEGDSFVANLLNNIMFFNGLPYYHWIFKTAYVSFAALVAMSFVIAPPGRRYQDPAARNLKRGLAATALLATLGFIFMYTAWCMEDYKSAWDVWRENHYQQELAHVSADAVKPLPPPKEERMPVYFLAFSGIDLLGLALVCWACTPRHEPP